MGERDFRIQMALVGLRPGKLGRSMLRPYKVKVKGHGKGKD
jgi:hypothetical protein